jgi:hypothetical protein
LNIIRTSALTKVLGANALGANALGASVAAVLLLSACNRKEEAAPAPAPAPPPVLAPVAPPPATPQAAVSGFNHSGTFDAAGYYLPEGEIRVGPYRLNHLGVGAASDFAQWEQGDRASAFGPILLQFDDTTSPLAPNELGAEAHAVSVRVLPTGYATDGRTLRFAGQDAKLGPVTFEGAFDTAALAQAKADGSGPQTVLKGTLEVGSTRIANTRFTFFAGD